MNTNKKSTRRNLTREEYAEKFNRLFADLNWIPEEPDEKIVQCKPPYPAYWFVASTGYLFTAYYNELRILKPHHRNTGLKAKDGTRKGQDWYYEFKKPGDKNCTHVPMQRVIADHFLMNEFRDAEKVEIHHKQKALTFDDPVRCNRASNLQVLPKDVHKELTKLASKTEEQREQEIQKKIKKSGCPEYHVTQEQMLAFLYAGLRGSMAAGEQPTVLMASVNNDTRDIVAEAHPVIKIE